MGGSASKPSKLKREFEPEKVLGSGSFGVVLRAKNKFDTASYAIKLIYDPSNIKSGEATNEIKILAKMSSHQNVVSYKASWIDTMETGQLQKLMDDISMDAKEIERFKCRLDNQAANIDVLCIQMELCEMNLATWMQQKAKINKTFIDILYWSIFCQIVEGLKHIHQYNIIHRDLKPENIFFCGNQVKIGDLGLARLMSNNGPVYENMTAGCGTPCYMAPEQTKSKYGKYVDIYALGLILAELFSSEKQERLSQFLWAMRSGNIPADISKQWPSIADLISKMVKIDSTQRIGLDAIAANCKTIEIELSKFRHAMVYCNGCKISQIRGIRYKCNDCEDFDLCETCKNSLEHNPEHSFIPMEETEIDWSNMMRRTVTRLARP